VFLHSVFESLSFTSATRDSNLSASCEAFDENHSLLAFEVVYSGYKLDSVTETLDDESVSSGLREGRRVEVDVLHVLEAVQGHPHQFVHHLVLEHRLCHQTLPGKGSSLEDKFRHFP
jgi:hypothetical protein